MSLSDNDILPICYRCDQKYLHFLLVSIESLLQHYTGKRTVRFYICTNENLDTTEIELLKVKYKFEYEIVKIDIEFLDRYNLYGDYTKLAIRRFCGFNYSNVVSNNRLSFNPFSRSKTIGGIWLFFLAVTTHAKVLCMDTDTLIVSDIGVLYDTDVSNVYLATCKDWDDTATATTFNPSVAVLNIERYQETAFEKIKVFLNELAINNTCTDTLPYFEILQKAICDVAGQSWIELDPSWNVPITHMEKFTNPKIFHFSESWSGNTEVITAYKELTAKYLKYE
jgi:lipopolysaccharide biosynthesis glycosyltransferase